MDTQPLLVRLFYLTLSSPTLEDININLSEEDRKEIMNIYICDNHEPPDTILDAIDYTINNVI